MIYSMEHLVFVTEMPCYIGLFLNSVLAHITFSVMLSKMYENGIGRTSIVRQWINIKTKWVIVRKLTHPTQQRSKTPLELCFSRWRAVSMLSGSKSLPSVTKSEPPVQRSAGTGWQLHMFLGWKRTEEKYITTTFNPSVSPLRITPLGFSYWINLMELSL